MSDRACIFAVDGLSRSAIQAGLPTPPWGKILSNAAARYAAVMNCVEQVATKFAKELNKELRALARKVTP